ncbi:MAG: hypothetical protein P4L42_15555 [Desulfocapsaceae bacterium]|nr:hypothetical protein [Desulfocapsaceae bacterium]
MKLTCPACGAIASAETWINDALCRETLALIAGLPVPLPKAILSYVALFRPQKTGLSWKKALRLVEEIKVLVKKGHVNVQGKVDRNCPPRLWAQAMDRMVERRVGLALPLKNHNYLRQVAWQLADQEDALAEKGAARGRRTCAANDPQPVSNPLDQYIQGLRDTQPSEEEMAQWKKNRLK